MSSNAPRRFIAGAVCPACSEVDKIYIVSEGDVVFRRCVRCDFEESLRPDGETSEGTGEWQPVKLKDS